MGVGLGLMLAVLHIVPCMCLYDHTTIALIPIAFMHLILTLHTHVLTADVLHQLLLTEYTVSLCTKRHSQMVLSHTL